MLEFSLKFVLENISIYLRSSTLVIGIAMVTVAMVTVATLPWEEDVSVWSCSVPW